MSRKMDNLGKDKQTFKTKSPSQNEYVDRITKGILCSITYFLRVISFKGSCEKMAETDTKHMMLQYGECALHAG